MFYYVDATVRLDPEFSTAVLLNELYGRFHKALAEGRIDSIGVSFPKATLEPKTMGEIMRIHGDKDPLEQLMSRRWWGALEDHFKVAPPRPVPDGSGFCAVRRVQAKSSPERLRRRFARRHGVSLAEAEARIPDSAAQRLDLPFLQVRSSSTSKTFKMFLAQEPAEVLKEGKFNYYGLSQVATVPWF